jgi:hypothetical protein
MSFLSEHKNILKDRTITDKGSSTISFNGITAAYDQQVVNYVVYCNRIVFFDAGLQWTSASGSPSDVRIIGFPYQKISFPVTETPPVFTNVTQICNAGTFRFIDGTNTMYSLIMIDTSISAVPQWIVHNTRSNSANYGGNLPVSAITTGTFFKILRFSGWYFTNGVKV